MMARIYELSKIKQALLIFLISITARVFLTFLFLDKYGPHATRGELWHWYAVGKGLVWLSPQDITGSMLEFAAGFFPGHFGVYAVMFLGILLSSITAVLVYLLALEFHDRKTAFVSGIVYSLLIEPLFSSTATFIHDLVQMPLMLLLLLCLVYAAKEKRIFGKILYIGAAIVSTYCGLKASQTFYLVFGAVLAYLAWVYFLRLFPRTKEGEDKAYSAFFIILILSSAIFIYFLAPRIIDQIFSSFPQGRYGSTDNLPMGWNFLWGRIGLAAFFLPAGIYLVYRKKDVVSFTILISGLLTASLVSRASRFAMIGYAVIVACAAVSWRKEWAKDAVTAYILIAAFFLFATGFDIVPLAETYAASALLAGIFIYLTAKNRETATSFLIPFIVLSVVLGYFVCVEKNTLSEVTTEDEYLSLNWLMENKTEGGKVLISWDRGDMASAVSGLSPVSDFGRINRTVHRFLWLGEKQAAEELAAANVSYVVITNRDFTSYSEAASVIFQSGGLAFEAPKELSIEEMKETTLYKMRYQPQDLKNFKPAYARINKPAGVFVLIYKVDLQESEDK